MPAPPLVIRAKTLEGRVQDLVGSELRRPVFERVLSAATRAESVAEAEVPRWKRALQGLADLLADSSLRGAARPALAPLELLLEGPTQTPEETLTLEIGTEGIGEELEAWLSLVPEPRVAEEARRHMELVRDLDWTQLEALLVDAFERHLITPGHRTSALDALQAVLRVQAFLEVALLLRVHAAWSELQRDLRQPFIALDASRTHHTILTRWRDLPKTGEMRVIKREGVAEIITPDANGQVGLRLDVHELHAHLVEAIRHWRSWHGLRHWAALQRLFTAAGRTGRIRWNLNDHMEALGLAARSRREPRIRKKIAAEVEALTRLEVAVYNRDGSLRLRGPILAVTQRGEALRGSEWALEGLELVIHPVLYDGVRKANGDLGTLWAPAPAQLAHVDERTHPHALALGLILPIRWRWDLGSGQEHLVLTGEKLLETAGIRRSPRNPGRAWQTLDRNLQVLQAIGGVGAIEWEPGERHTLGGRCRLYPPLWVRDRLVHHLLPQEGARTTELLVGADLAEWRRLLGLTQAALADQLGLSERTLRRAEAQPDRPLTASLRAALGRMQGNTLARSESV